MRFEEIVVMPTIMHARNYSPNQFFGIMKGRFQGSGGHADTTAKIGNSSSCLVHQHSKFGSNLKFMFDAMREVDEVS